LTAERLDIGATQTAAGAAGRDVRLGTAIHTPTPWAPLSRRLAAECLGTAVLVAGGPGAATAVGILAANTGTGVTEAEWVGIGLAHALALGGATYPHFPPLSR
jgi:hypothetical protein